MLSTWVYHILILHHNSKMSGGERSRSAILTSSTSSPQQPSPWVPSPLLPSRATPGVEPPLPSQPHQPGCAHVDLRVAVLAHATASLLLDAPCALEACLESKRPDLFVPFQSLRRWHIYQGSLRRRITDRATCLGIITCSDVLAVRYLEVQRRIGE